MEGAGDGTSTMRDIRREAGRSEAAAPDKLEDRVSGDTSSKADKRKLELLARLLRSAPDWR